MSKVTIRFWKDYPPQSSSYQHISLETSNYYVSFHPKSSKVRHDLEAKSKKIHSVEKLEEDIRVAGPPNKQIQIEVDSEAIDTAIGFLKSRQLLWSDWYTEISEGFNSATVVLLLLKIGGGHKKLNRRDYMEDEDYQSENLKVFFEELPLVNFDDYRSFCRRANVDVTPKEVTTLAGSISLKSKTPIYKKPLFWVGLLISVGIFLMSIWRSKQSPSSLEPTTINQKSEGDLIPSHASILSTLPLSVSKDSSLSSLASLPSEVNEDKSSPSFGSELPSSTKREADFLSSSTSISGPSDDSSTLETDGEFVIISDNYCYPDDIFHI